jgi:Family of unknown function (DUF6206)
MISPDLETLEADVSNALSTGDTSRLRLVGHGEISLVLGWPPDNPVVACKRLPPFSNFWAFEKYRDVVVRYIGELRHRGVRVVDTELHHLRRGDRRVTGFHVQPLLPPDALAIDLLRATSPADGHPLLEAVVDTVARATTERVGLDAQLSNWMWLDDEPWQLDLTTPFLLDDHRRPAFDLAPFLASLPAVVRPVVGREMTTLILRWTTARGSLVDLAANLVKEDLTDWLEPALAMINARVDPPVTRAEAERVHAQDRRLWPVLFRLQRVNRWWQRRVRHRQYEFLLPERTTYEQTNARAAPS